MTNREDAMHEHTWTRSDDMESCECGASRIVVDEATAKRRSEATIAMKRRMNALLAERGKAPYFPGV